MREMHLTWSELQDTPIEVRDLHWRFIQMERTAAAERTEKAKREAQGENGALRVPR